jgi:hypothetical protein
MMRVVQFAIDAGVPLFAWRHQLRESLQRTVDSLNEQQRSHFYDEHPELVGYVVRGASVRINTKINPAKGAVRLTWPLCRPLAQYLHRQHLPLTDE